MILNWIAHIFGVLVVLMTAIPLFRSEEWWIRAFDFPRLQVAVIGVISLVGLLASTDEMKQGTSVLVALLSLAVCYQTARILPYTPIWNKQTNDADQLKTQDSLSLMITNVLMTNRKSRTLKRIITDCDPDLALFMEVDDWWIQQLSFLDETYHYKVLYPQSNTYGIALYSKYELVDTEIKELFESNVPSIHTNILLTSGGEVVLRCVHPKPPAPQEATTSVKRDAELLLVGKEVEKIDKPVIVAGDLNDVAWSHTTTLFQKVSHLLDPRRGRGLFSTFDARNPFMRWPLDHVFHSKHFELLKLQRLGKFGSDHFPVFVRLALTPEAQLHQEEPQADQSEQQDAHKKIAKGANE